MPNPTKPIFTADELNPTKTGIIIGTSKTKLKYGPEFTKNETGFKHGIAAVKELLDGTAHKRHNHMKINKFARAKFWDGKNEIWFGLAYLAQSLGPSKIGKSALEKYNQLLGYYLHDAGWEDIQQDKNSGNFIIKLNNKTNLELFQLLSSSIGFDEQSPLPDTTNLMRAAAAIGRMQKKQSIAAKIAQRQNRE